MEHNYIYARNSFYSRITEFAVNVSKFSSSIIHAIDECRYMTKNSPTLRYNDGWDKEYDRNLFEQQIINNREIRDKCSTATIKTEIVDLSNNYKHYRRYYI